MSIGSTDKVKRPSSIRENSSSSSTIPDSRRASLAMMAMPLRTSPSSRASPLMMVSAQPVMAVKGVRSSWETEEMNSDFMLSACLIRRDMSLMASVRSPTSSSNFFSTWMT